LVSGLLPKDFMILEGGAKQELRYFTSDPFALSAAIVFDQGLPDVAVQKINQTFSALEGAFSQYDEVAIYTYSSAVRKLKDFGAFGKGTGQIFSLLKSETGRTGGPQVYSGPLGPQGPTVNGLPVGGGPNLIQRAPQETHSLNDALLRAAIDLGKRPRERRKVIFIISDGRESGSEAAYADVLRVLLTNNITVYAVAVDDAAIPVIRKLKEIKLPRKGYGNILPKYTSATGGEDFPEFSQSAIEEAYNRAMGDARNQYTLGYYSHAQPGVYRQLEVKVARAGLKVHAKDGFYPLPPARSAQP
jgi:VWFA-related protein